ncbi:MAG: GFA family protein [Alphaproteobacteria bacterium]
MTKLSGKCLCGDISFSCDTEIKMMANCHCSDCQAATGAAIRDVGFRR